MTYSWKLHGLQGVILGTYQQGRVDLMHLSLTALPSTGLCTPTQPPLYGCPPALSRLFTTEMFVPLWSRGDTQAPEDWINAGHSLSTAHRNKQTGFRFLVLALVPNSLEPGIILFSNLACSHPDPRHPKHWQSAAKYPLPCRCPSLIRQVIDCR